MLEVTARSVADILEIQSNTTILFYQKTRKVIAWDESYFSVKPGHNSAGKAIALGTLKREAKVVISDTKSNTLMPIFSNKIKPDSVVCTNSWRSYNVLYVCHFYHEHINHFTDVAKSNNHINGIENFWSQAKRILRKYDGIHKALSPFFLNGYEFHCVLSVKSKT